MMNALAALSLIAAAPQGTLGPIQPPMGGFPPVVRLVNLLANPGFELGVGEEPASWTVSGAVFSYDYSQWLGGPLHRGSYTLPAYGRTEVGRTGSRSFDLGTASFGLSRNEVNYALESSVSQTLATPASANAIVGASAWVGGTCEITATIYYSLGRPTSLTRSFGGSYWGDDWQRFDFKSAIATNRTVTGIRIKASLPIEYSYGGGTVGYGGAHVGLDDVALLTLP